MDRYAQLVNTPIGRLVAKQVGLPNPPRLERHRPGQPVIAGPVLLGAAPGSRLGTPIAATLDSVGAEVLTAMDDALRTAVADAGLDAAIFNPETAPESQRFKALVLDATGIASSDELHAAWAFLHPAIRRVQGCARVIVLGTPPEDCAEPAQAIAQRALEGLSRALAKEVRHGGTAQLLYVRPGGEDELDSTLRFLLSPRSAFVSGQVVRIGPAVSEQRETIEAERPLTGKVALVTGAARGIGAAIAEVLARDGAHVVGLDVPAMSEELTAGMDALGGSVLTADITADAAPATIASHLLEFHQGVDVVVHNAGVTRDKTLGRMDAGRWDMVIDINLTAPQRIDQELFARQAVRDNGRIVCVSSISGIAGNAGQTNYSTSKAGVIGIVQAFAPVLAQRGVTINAVAPGFIETQMTAAMPLGTREVGRRLNSLSQGGLPVDVAETIAWFASPASRGVTGNVVRVCGQSLLGGVMADRELRSAPGMLALFGRAALGAIPGASRLSFVGGGGGEVPDRALTLTAQTDRDRLAAYDRVCGFPLTDTVPLTWPHMLAFPLHLALISAGDFPLAAIGLVHIANRIVSHRPIAAAETLELRVWSGPLEPHPRGTQFAIHTEARVGDELVWEEISTNLRRGRAPEDPDSARAAGAEIPSTEALAASATWRLPGDLGRRYGAVSGDLNPIHVHPLSARLFGFPAAIAHGMWTQARCLAALHSLHHEAITVEVAFKRPILLPATVRFAERRERGAVHFGVRDRARDTPHLDGLLTF